MALGQKLSLRAYSFSFRKFRSQGLDKVYGLNSELRLPYMDNSGQEYIYPCALELLKDFVKGNAETNDKEGSQQLFSCSFDPLNQGETDEYTYLFFSVFSGYYGYASELVDRNTKSVVYTKSRDEADVKQFYVMVAVPKDTELSVSRRGLIFFQEIGVFGVKTITANTMQSFFSQKQGLTFKTQNLAPDFYLKKLFEDGLLQKIKLARNSVSADSSDRLYGAGFGREERTLIPLQVTEKLKQDLKHVSTSKYQFFTFDNQEYPEVKMVVQIGDRIRTINLHGLEELSVEEALPSELLLADGTINFSEFKKHVLVVAEEYLNHLPNDF